MMVKRWKVNGYRYFVFLQGDSYSPVGFCISEIPAYILLLQLDQTIKRELRGKNMLGKQASDERLCLKRERKVKEG